jgi:hypothetical protein
VTRLQTVQEQATSAREQVRAQQQMLRDQTQMARDMERMRSEMTPVIEIGRPHGPSPRQEKILFAGFVILVLAAVVVLYPLMRGFGRRLEQGGRKAESIDTGSAERLARIEQAVEAMAIEIERISEGQRFTTKLLAARADAPVSLEH